jgi:UDP-2-acetamido-3-amino-2,3-dideoxy-glucuronate N-acetyltransferase
MDFASTLKGSVAVIGCGYWGKNLIRNFFDLKALALICDRNEEALVRFKERYQEVQTCLALNEVISRDDIKGVAIATPAETHYTVAREVLLAGKHVFVEKPFVLHESQAGELIELAEKVGRIIMVGHVLQYHPVFVKLKELTDTGELGRINYIYSHRLNLGKIRREENILWSFAPHDISMILSLAGEEPESIQAIGGCYLHQKIADVTTTHLSFPSGLLAHLFVSWLHPFKEQKLVVVGDKKMAVFDDTQTWSDKLLLYPHEIRWQGGMPIPAKAEPEHLDIPEGEPLRLECEDFIRCMSEEKTPITDGAEGMRVLKVLNAAQRSLDNHGHTISIDSPIDHHQEVKVNASGRMERTYEKCFVDQTAVIDENVKIGVGTKIWHFSHILSGCSIGHHCTIGQNVVIGPECTIGDGCKIQNNVSVYKGVTLEDGVFCGPSMVFTNVYNPRAEIRKMDQVRPTIVKKGATIGANATIVCGLEIGRYAFIGAGAVVTSEIPDYALFVGNPAHQAGWMCRCGERLTNELECKVCNRKYEFRSHGLEEISMSSCTDNIKAVEG